MTATTWKRLQDVFHGAMARTGTERKRYLEEACGDDAELRREIEVMLAEPDADLPETLSGTVLAELIGDDADVVPESRRIGGYLVHRRLGSGGAGTVYEAQQIHPRRTVALKVLRAGISSEEAMRRIEYESQVLARLRHPGIAQIIEAGTYLAADERRPFFAMELVPGSVTLLEHARRHALVDDERLELFAQVCDAVHHGHQVGVIHRDLKPANVLVTPEGGPKVIDFGVARLVDLETTMLAHFDDGSVVGTLQYMSPEQCDAKRRIVDARADVYALGVILFELLTGERPYAMSSDAALPEILRAILEREPRRPSTLRRILQGDLDAIVMKALEKEPHRRYQSASELAADVRRSLRDEPVLARPASAVYQMRKFARRNRPLVIAATSAVLALVSGLVASSLLFARAWSAQRLSERNAYVANIAAASAAVRAHDVAGARSRLEAAPPSLRGWEWHHLMRQLDRSVVSHAVGADGVRCLALDTRRERLAVGGRDGTLRILRRGDLVELARADGGGPVIDALAFSPDGRWLASGSTGEAIVIHSADALTPVTTLSGHRDHVHGLWFDPSSALLASASKDGTVRIWSVATWSERAVLRGHDGRVTQVAFLDDGNAIVSCSWDATIRLWDVDTAAPLRTMRGHEGAISDLAVDDERGWIASASTDGTVRLWNARTAELITVLDARMGQVTAVDFGPGDSIVAGMGNGSLHVWRGESWELATILHGHVSDVMDVLMDPSDNRVVTASFDDTVRRWDILGERAPALHGHTAWVYDVAVSADGRRLASAGGGRLPADDRSVRLWDYENGRELARHTEHAGLVRALAFGPDDAWIASVSVDGSLRRWTVGSAAVEVRHAPAGVELLAIDVNGGWLATGGDDGVLRLWRADDLAAGPTASTSGSAMRHVEWAPDGRMLATGSGDGVVTLWDIDDDVLQARHRFTPLDGVVDAAAFDSTGTRLAAATRQGNLAIWDVPSTRRVMHRPGHVAIHDLAFAPNGERLAVASQDHTVRLFDTDTWEPVATLHGHTADVLAVTFSPDGHDLVTGSSDLTIRIWDGRPSGPQPQ